MVTVRISISAWHAYRSLPDDDPARAEIERILFGLVEHGVALPGAHPTDWPWGKGTAPGYALDLTTTAGFVAYAPLVDPRTDEAFVGVIHIVIEGLEG